MKVFMIGGTGLLGSAAARIFIDRGHSVKSVALPPLPEGAPIPEEMEISLLLVDRDTITAMNRQHMDKDGPTDVLAFPIDLPGESLPNVPSVLGDVMLCPDVAAEQAVAAGQSLQDELQLLVAHGILHLLGMDHADPEQERIMFGRTAELLAMHRGGS